MSVGAPLAIVAGGGAFPEMVAASALAEGRSVFVVRLAGSCDGVSLLAYDSIEARPEQLGYIFKELRVRGIEDLVLIGRMERPRIIDLRPDFTTLCLLPRLLPALVFKGDDGLLKRVRRMLEGQGFRLRGAHEFLRAYVAPEGVIGQVAPTAIQENDIAVGIEAARAHGLRDRGQAVLVLAGDVIAEEGREGTDAMIAAHGREGAVLVKVAKPQQDMALDMPAIGPDTVRGCVAKGMAGIAVGAGTTLVSGRQEAVALANAHGLFLIGLR